MYICHIATLRYKITLRYLKLDDNPGQMADRVLAISWWLYQNNMKYKLALAC